MVKGKYLNHHTLLVIFTNGQVVVVYLFVMYAMAVK